MNGPFVGILVNDAIFKGIPRGRTRHEKIKFYDIASREYGIIPCYFRLKDISLTKGTVEAYILRNHRYVLASIPLPKWIHNRGMYFQKNSRKKLLDLEKLGCEIFNRKTRFKKMAVHRILMKEKELISHLPDTLPGTLKNLKHMMRKYPALIIKPDSGSIGIGIMMLQKKEKGWKLYYPKKKRFRKNRFQIFNRQIPPYLKQKLNSRRYIIQQRIPLMTSGGRPYDLRVSVQKNHSGEWQVTGIVAKLAAKQQFVTNVAQGGTACPFEKIFKAVPAIHVVDMESKIIDVSLKIARQLEKHIKGLADLGLDIGIRKDAEPMFIECNARDLRYSFKEGRLYEKWRDTYRNPIAFASAIILKEKKHPVD